MDKGEVMQVATPAEIYEAPGSRFVADFVGSVNLFEGRVADRDGNRVTVEVPDTMTIRSDNGGEARPGDTVWFAIRPEKVRITARRPAEASYNAAEGEVWDIAYLGDMTVYRVKLRDGRIVRCSMLNSQRIVEEPLTWHDRAWISFDADAGVVLTR
jgi:putrescine transport system ATP-binding protein